MIDFDKINGHLDRTHWDLERGIESLDDFKWRKVATALIAVCHGPIASSATFRSTA